ncbi:MAG: DNA repair protein RadA [Clostridia bacterium]|nr:DNA repair protein RadA [Clostridia bacterium]
MKIKTGYICSECGNVTAKWFGQCPSCKSWNTLEEYEDTTELDAKSAKKAVIKREKALSYSIDSIDITEEPRAVTGIEEFDRVLGGGIVKGSVTLLSGEPGIGKSTLLLQICDVLGKSQKVLYVSGEESPSQIKLRAKRLGVSGKDILIYAETDIDEVIAEINASSPEIVIIDSIQAMSDRASSSVAGSITQVKNTASKLIRCAKTDGISVIIVGHVNKDGAIAGPKVLEHMVDTVLYFDGEKQYSYRMLRAVKNRFGSTNEIGIFEMNSEGLTEVANPSEYLLSQRTLNVSGTCTLCAMEGTRPILAEIQALVTKSFLNVPRRTSNGFDYNRLSMLSAVLEKRLGLRLGINDVYLNVVGGLHVADPSTDLPACLALISGYKDIAISEKLVAMGEIGLAGECRAIALIEQRVRESIRLGFDKIVIPYRNYEKSKSQLSKLAKDAEIIPVKSLFDALKLFS